MLLFNISIKFLHHCYYCEESIFQKYTLQQLKHTYVKSAKIAQNISLTPPCTLPWCLMSWLRCLFRFLSTVFLLFLLFSLCSFSFKKFSPTSFRLDMYSVLTGFTPHVPNLYDCGTKIFQDFSSLHWHYSQTCELVSKKSSGVQRAKSKNLSAEFE